jgi:hypothetical protein
MKALFLYIDQMNDILFLALFAVFWLTTVCLYSIWLKRWEKKHAKN